MLPVSSQMKPPRIPPTMPMAVTPAHSYWCGQPGFGRQPLGLGPAVGRHALLFVLERRHVEDARAADPADERVAEGESSQERRRHDRERDVVRREADSAHDPGEHPHCAEDRTDREDVGLGPERVQNVLPEMIVPVVWFHLGYFRPAYAVAGHAAGEGDMGTGDRAEADRPGDAGRDVTGTDGIESAEFALEDGQPLAEEDDEPQ